VNSGEEDNGVKSGNGNCDRIKEKHVLVSYSHYLSNPEPSLKFKGIFFLNLRKVQRLSKSLQHEASKSSAGGRE